MPVTPNLQTPNSALAGIEWPAITDPFAALVLSLQAQFEESERWPSAQLQAAQFEQLALLVEHARREVPFYRERLKRFAKSGSLTPERWRTLPLLTRAEIRAAGTQLKAKHVPPEHGTAHPVRTSGSTGEPLSILETTLSKIFFKATNLRFYLWHGLEFAHKVAAIRQPPAGKTVPPQGLREGNWAVGFDTGPAVLIDVGTSLTEQLAWLVREQAPYLISYPTNLTALAKLSFDTGTQLPWLKSVQTFGEAVDPAVREWCQRAWGVPVLDKYSAIDVGMIALQCPKTEQLHCLAETVLVEVIDHRGEPCRPGQIGRVVVTPLHAYGMPLLRYAIGDYAELGGPCTCGRSLPVLKRVLGRTRNMLMRPDGTTFWPTFAHLTAIEGVGQFQLVQTSRREVVLNIVARTDRGSLHDDDVRAALSQDLKADFIIKVERRPSIPRQTGGKYEEVISVFEDKL